MRVAKMVRQLVDGCSGPVHAARTAATIKVTEGIIRGGKLSPATIGRNLPGPEGAKPKHDIKCVDRLLGNPHMVRDRLFFFLAVAHRLLHGCSRPIVLVDWTHVGEKLECLVAAVPIGGRALPIYLEVHPQKKLGNGKVESCFLRQLQAILPAGCKPIVVCDAGFKGPFFRSVLELGWDFVGRVRGTTKAITLQGKKVSKDEFYADASIAPKDLGALDLFTTDPLRCRLLLIRKRRKPGPKRPPPKCKEERELRKAALDPWLLATSVQDGDAASIVRTYAKRMQIEETFRDTKNPRFGWSFGNVNLSTVNRAATLLLLASIALVVVTLIGMAAEHAGAHLAYRANTAKRRVLSFFVLACAILRRRDSSYLSVAAFRGALAKIAGIAGA
jgi:hypothetical protein